MNGSAKTSGFITPDLSLFIFRMSSNLPANSTDLDDEIKRRTKLFANYKACGNTIVEKRFIVGSFRKQTR